MSSIRESMLNMHLLKLADMNSLKELSVCARFKKYTKGEILFHDKQEVGYLYFLDSGRASLYKLNSLGEKKVIFTYGAGYVLNEEMLLELPASVTCEFLEHSTVLMLPVGRFKSVMSQDARLSMAVVDALSIKVRRLYRQLKNTTNALSGEKRLAAKLYKLARDYGVEHPAGIRINMTLTVTYLADMIGSKRETVSRQMKKLAELGLIQMHNSEIIVKDPEQISKYFKSP